MQQFAGLLQAVPRSFAYGLPALIEQGGAPGARVDEPADAADADAPPRPPQPRHRSRAAEAPAERRRRTRSICRGSRRRTDRGSRRGRRHRYRPVADAADTPTEES